MTTEIFKRKLTAILSADVKGYCRYKWNTLSEVCGWGYAEAKRVSQSFCILKFLYSLEDKP